MSEESKRLAQVVAAMVPCSRREAEQYIAEGRVRVNGRVVEVPQFWVTGERVEIDPGHGLEPPLAATLLLHKPAGMDMAQAQALLRDDAHWAGDASGIRPLKTHRIGLATPLPLPTPASGLAVFSQDRSIVRKLGDHGRPTEEELVADVTGTIRPGGLERLGGGLVFEGRPLPQARISWQNETRLRIAAKAMPLEMLPWMCGQVGLELKALKRIRIGRVPMAALPPGQWRYLAPGERF